MLARAELQVADTSPGATQRLPAIRCGLCQASLPAQRTLAIKAPFQTGLRPSSPGNAHACVPEQSRMALQCTRRPWSTSRCTWSLWRVAKASHRLCSPLQTCSRLPQSRRSKLAVLRRARLTRAAVQPQQDHRPVACARLGRRARHCALRPALACQGCQEPGACRTSCRGA